MLKWRNNAKEQNEAPEKSFPALVQAVFILIFFETVFADPIQIIVRDKTFAQVFVSFRKLRAAENAVLMIAQPARIRRSVRLPAQDPVHQKAHALTPFPP